MNSNVNDQLCLAIDESDHLKERIKKLQNENSGLRADIDDLTKQKEESLTRYIVCT